MNRLETKTRLIRILREDLICSTGLTLTSAGNSANIFLNCAVVCEITISLDQASQSARHDVPAMLGPQDQRVNRVIRQKVLPSGVQRQAPRARCDPARPAHVRAASQPRQTPFEAALSS